MNAATSSFIMYAVSCPCLVAWWRTRQFTRLMLYILALMIALPLLSSTAWAVHMTVNGLATLFLIVNGIQEKKVLYDLPLRVVVSKVSLMRLHYQAA